MIGVYPFGTPLLYAIMLFRNRKKIRSVRTEIVRTKSSYRMTRETEEEQRTAAGGGGASSGITVNIGGGVAAFRVHRRARNSIGLLVRLHQGQLLPA